MAYLYEVPADAPMQAGVPVIRRADGALGVTITAPYKRSPTIGVMFLGETYSVIMPLADIVAIDPARISVLDR